MKSIFEEMVGIYRQEEYQLGQYGRKRRNFMKEHPSVRYSELIVEGQLWNHLAEIDKLCNARMEVMIAAMKKQEGVTEALKAADQMEWVRRMNSIHNRGEEIVLYELVYEV